MKALFLLTALCTAMAYAQSPADTRAADDKPAAAPAAQPDPMAEFFVLGWGATQRSSLFQGESSQQQARSFPFIHYRSQALDITGISASYHFAHLQQWRWSLHLGWVNGDAHDSSSATVLAGTAAREAGQWLGPSVRYKADWGQLTALLETDVAQQSQAQQLRAAYARPFRLGYLQITPSLHWRWMSSTYVNYYYGVRADEATASRPVYSPGASSATWVGLNAMVPVSRNDGFVLDYQTHQLGSAIAHSPLVAGPRYERFSLAYMHRF